MKKQVSAEKKKLIIKTALEIIERFCFDWIDDPEMNKPSPTNMILGSMVSLCNLKKEEFELAPLFKKVEKEIIEMAEILKKDNKDEKKPDLWDDYS